VPIFQYAVLINTYSTNWDSTKELMVYSTQWTLWRSDALEGEFLPENSNLVTILDSLGSEGWRLTSSTVLDTARVQSTLGWPESSMAVRTRYIFERAVKA